MTEYVSVEREAYPGCTLPLDLHTPVWRYMDISKFQSLLEQKALYLCRADRLQDRFEGSYSRQQILEMDDYDLDLMWQGYVKKAPGVAIKSSVKKLQQICDNSVEYYPIDISIVKYFDQAKGEPISYSGTPSAFLYKDHHFQLDNELRIIHTPNISVPSPEYIFLPVVLGDLIEEIVLQPKSSLHDLESVREAIDGAGLTSIPIQVSRDDRELIK